MSVWPSSFTAFNVSEPLGPLSSSEVTFAATGGFLDIQVGRPGGFPSQATAPVVAQLVTADGTSGPAHRILEGSATTVDQLHVQELDSGGWLVVAQMTGDPEVFPPRVAIQELTAAGAPVGPMVVFTNPVADLYRPLPAGTTRVTADPDLFPTTGGGRRGDVTLYEVTARPDGTLLAVAPHSAGGSHSLLLQHYDSGGSPIGPRHSIPLDRVARELTLTTSEEGDILLSWIAGPESIPHFATLERDSSVPSDPVAHSVGGIDHISFDDAGNILLAWSESIPHGDYYHSTSSWVQFGDIDGFDAPLLVTANLEGGAGTPLAIEALAEDLFLYTTSYSATILDAEGWRYGYVPIWEPPSSTSGLPNFGTALTEDGDLMAWAPETSYPSTPRQFRLYDMPEILTLTEGDDNLTLTEGAFVRAGAGDDFVQGSAQDDILDGQAGADTLLGGTGNDLLRVNRDGGLVDGGVGGDTVHVDLFDEMYQEWERPDALNFEEHFTLETDGTLQFQYEDVALTFRSIEEFNFNGYEVSYNRIMRDFFEGPDDYIDMRFSSPVYGAGGGDDRVIGSAADETIYGGVGADTLFGGTGRDELHGGDHDDYIHGSHPLDDPTTDRADTVYAGDGADQVFGGFGNDLLYGMDGDDTISGGFGADSVIGQNGNDVLTGGAFSDILFGNAGDDFLNGGFGHDRINGGTGADQFFHVGVEGHGSDWVQDYTALDGDVLLFGDDEASADDFQVNFTHTESKSGERAGDDTVEEAFVIYKPTNQILWALVDGAGQDQINLQIGGDVFDLLG